MIRLNDDERAKWWEVFAPIAVRDGYLVEESVTRAIEVADRAIEVYRSRLPKTGPADAWPTIEAVLAYDDERTVPASEDIRFALQAIWDKPHRAPLYLADLLEGFRGVPEPALVLPPDHPRKQLEATLEVNRIAFEALPQWARDACSTGEVFAPQVETESMRTATGEVLARFVVTDVNGVHMLRGGSLNAPPANLTARNLLTLCRDVGTVVEVRSAKS